MGIKHEYLLRRVVQVGDGVGGERKSGFPDTAHSIYYFSPSELSAKAFHHDSPPGHSEEIKRRMMYMQYNTCYSIHPLQVISPHHGGCKHASICRHRNSNARARTCECMGQQRSANREAEYSIGFGAYEEVPDGIISGDVLVLMLDLGGVVLVRHLLQGYTHCYLQRTERAESVWLKGVQREVKGPMGGPA